jgi:sugar phosphate isomerase/epimerase
VRYAGIGDEAAPDLPGQLAAVAALGWDAIELRTVDGLPLAALDEAAFDQIAGQIAASRTTVAAVASGIGNWSRPITGDARLDLAELSILARRAAALGSRHLRVMSYPNDGLPEPEWSRRAIARLVDLAARAEQAGLVLLHENCAGWAASDADRMLRLCDAAGPALRLLFDTGNGVAHGYDGYALLTRIAEHVAHVHVKDAYPRPGGPAYTLPGAGHARVGDCLRLLLAHGYTGIFSIEPHLSLRPHEAVGNGEPDGFHAAGAALDRLVRTEVLACLSGWRPVTGGLAHR